MINLENMKASAVNALSWSTSRRILVIESDDWGMIRMGSEEAYNRLKKKGYPLDECPYNCYDTLELENDINGLGEVLMSVKDQSGSPAVITANMILGNPDFAKIRDEKFKEFHVKPFWKTIEDYGRKNVLSAYHEANKKRLLMPQLHGRDHIASEKWLQALRQNNVSALDAFEEGMFTVHTGGQTSGRRDFLDAVGLAPNETGYACLPDSLHQAQDWFERFWGFKSQSFIAPCYTWHPMLEEHLNTIGVRYIQGARVQRVPVGPERGQIRSKRHVTGQKNSLGQHYLVRNVSLEPSLVGNEARCLDLALAETHNAFRHNAPAIVSSHRLNYIGGLDPSNRDRGLRLLSNFLLSVKESWPDVEFMSSDGLGRLIEA